MFRIACLTIFGALAVYATDSERNSPDQTERAEIAKVAVEWLLFDDWKQSKPKNAYPQSRTLPYLAHLRNALASTNNPTFKIGIIGTKNEVENSFLYDRAAKTLVSAPDRLPRFDRNAIYVEIGRTSDGWNVRIGKEPTYCRIEIDRDDQVYYVGKFNRAFSSVD